MISLLRILGLIPLLLLACTGIKPLQPAEYFKPNQENEPIALVTYLHGEKCPIRNWKLFYYFSYILPSREVDGWIIMSTEQETTEIEDSHLRLMLPNSVETLSIPAHEMKEIRFIREDPKDENVRYVPIETTRIEMKDGTVYTLNVRDGEEMPLDRSYDWGVPSIPRDVYVRGKADEHCHVIAPEQVDIAAGRSDIGKSIVRVEFF